MPGGRTLFERLERGEVILPNYRPGQHDLLEETMESVRLNLRHLLRTRWGMSEALADYGLPALSDILAEDQEALGRLVNAIQVTIEKYEPRLKQIKVQPITEEEDVVPLRKLQLTIDAVLLAGDERHRVRYQTGLDRDGSLEISR